MNREEALRKTAHYRCRLCGQLSPISAVRCENAGCGAQLGLHGEICPGEEETYVPPAANCPHCGKEIAADDGVCPHCGKKGNGPSAGDTGARTVQEDLEKHARRWKLAAIYTAIFSLIFMSILTGFLAEASEQVDRYSGISDAYDNLSDDYSTLKNSYNDLKGKYDTQSDNYRKLDKSYNELSEKYDKLSDDHKALKDDYDELSEKHDKLNADYDKLSADYEKLKAEYDAALPLIKDTLYTVTVKDVYNGDSDCNKINDDLTASQINRLVIRIWISAPDVKNRWAEPYKVVLVKSGKQVASWTCKPGDQYDDKTASYFNRLYTEEELEPGTYVAEFRHKGILLLEYEFVLK